MGNSSSFPSRSSTVSFATSAQSDGQGGEVLTAQVAEPEVQQATVTAARVQ